MFLLSFGQVHVTFEMNLSSSVLNQDTDRIPVTDDLPTPYLVGLSFIYKIT